MYKRYQFLLITAILSTLFTLPLKGNVRHIRSFRFTGQLPSVYVNKIAQDHQGLIWFLTREWVAIYDGYAIQTLPLPDTGLSGAGINATSILFKNEKEVLIGTQLGLYIYNRISGKYTYIQPNKEDPESKSNIICDITLSPAGAIYIATRNGIFYFPKDKPNDLQTFSMFPNHKTFDELKKGERIARTIIVDSHGDLWIGTEGDGLVEIDPETGKKGVFISEGKQRYRGDIVNTLHIDLQEKLWVGTTKGLFYFDSETQKLILAAPAQHSFTSIASLDDNTLLLGSETSLYQYNKLTKELTPVPQWMAGSFANNLFIDSSSCCWIGSPRGVFRYDKSNIFKWMQSQPNDPCSLSSNAINVLHGDHINNTLWIGFNGYGINRYEINNNCCTHYNYPTVSGSNNEYLYVRSMVCLPNSQLIAGTDGGLIGFDAQNNNFTPYFLPGYPFKRFKLAYSLSMGKDRNLWIGAVDQGLFKYSFNTGQLSHITYPYPNNKKDIYTNIRYLFEDSFGQLWIAFHPGGLGRYNPETQTIYFYTDKNTNGLLTHHTVEHIQETDNGRLIIGTSAGISIYDLRKNQFEPFPIAHHPINKNSIYGIALTKTKWWFTTNTGIFCFNKGFGNPVHFTPQDGLQDPIFSSKAITTVNKDIFFGGDNGLFFTPSQWRVNNTFKPTPSITEIFINGKKINKSDWYSSKKEGSITSWDNIKNIKINITANSYNKEWRNQIKYRIHPTDTSWYFLDAGIRSIQIPQLKAGIYTIEVAASNSDGIYGDAIILATVRVHRWIWILIPILIALLTIAFFFIFKVKNRKIHVRKQWKTLRKFVRRMEPSLRPNLYSGKKNDSIESLKELMQQEHLYKNKRLTKAELATRLKMTEAQLSSCIKEEYGQTFTEFINTYRVNAVKEKIKDPAYANYTFMAIAEDCGFNSKTSFFRVFKEQTGETPSEYVQKIRGSQQEPQDLTKS